MTARSDLPGGVHLVREPPTEAIRYAGVHPSSSTKRPSAGLILSTKETLDPRPLYSCAVRGWPVKQTHLPLPEYGGPIPAQAAVLLVSEELSNEATTQGAHTVIPRGVSANKPTASQVIRRIR